MHMITLCFVSRSLQVVSSKPILFSKTNKPGNDQLRPTMQAAFWSGVRERVLGLNPEVVMV